MELKPKDIQRFQEIVLSKGKELYRDMPWRNDCNFYYVLLSEIMLQQTQVPRVLIKFQEFITAFPTIESMAQADFQAVLTCWSGLGYNRRAKYLHDSIKAICAMSTLPATIQELQALPGIGPNTAASILVYSNNEPLVFVETNIRTVYIYHFLQNETEKIDESIIQSLVKQTMFTQNPREWYWALMDYGTFLKKSEGNFNKRSKMHTTQSKFEGSERQKRAQILRLILAKGSCSAQEIGDFLGIELGLVEKLVKALCKESLLLQVDSRFVIAS